MKLLTHFPCFKANLYFRFSSPLTASDFQHTTALISASAVPPLQGYTFGGVFPCDILS